MRITDTKTGLTLIEAGAHEIAVEGLGDPVNGWTHFIYVPKQVMEKLVEHYIGNGLKIYALNISLLCLLLSRKKNWLILFFAQINLASLHPCKNKCRFNIKIQWKFLSLRVFGKISFEF